MEDTQENVFELPEEYKDVQSVQGCKSVSDLCKRIVDNESFIGKLKSERAMPNANDSDEVWNNFIGKTKAVAESQDWTDTDEALAKVFKDAGIVKQQSKSVIDYFKAQEDKLYDEADFNTRKNDMFKGKETTARRIDSMLSRIDKGVLEELNNTKNDQLLSVYKVLGEIADKMAVEESHTPPTTTTTPDTTKVFDQNGKINADVLSKMQDEILAIPNVPNKQELKAEIFKKYGWQ